MSSSAKIALIVAALAVIGGAGYFLARSPESVAPVVPGSNPVVTQPITTVTEPTPTETVPTTPTSPVTPDTQSSAPQTGAPIASTEAPKVVATTKTLSHTTTYQEPDGTATISFDLVVDGDGVVKSITTKNLTTPPNRETSQYQSKFSAAIGAKVVGMKISEIKGLDRVGGASLTTDAFNASLAQLAAQL